MAEEIEFKTGDFVKNLDNQDVYIVYLQKDSGTHILLECCSGELDMSEIEVAAWLLKMAFFNDLDDLKLLEVDFKSNNAKYELIRHTNILNDSETKINIKDFYREVF